MSTLPEVAPPGPSHPGWDWKATQRTAVSSTLVTLATASVALTGGLASRSTAVVVCLGALVVGVVVVVRKRSGSEGRVWWALAVGVVVLVLSSTVSQVTTPSSSSLDGRHGQLAMGVVGLLACPTLFATQVALLQGRRRRALVNSDAWLDAVSTAAVLTALAGALLVPRLHAGGTPLDVAWVSSARVAAELILTATAVANCSLIGWSRDARLWKLSAIFALLTAADAVQLLAAGQLLAETAAAGALALRAGALVLLLAASWRPSGGTKTSAVATWSQLLAAVNVAIFAAVVMVLDHVRDVPSASIVLTAVAVALVVVKVCLLFSELLSLLEIRRLASTDDLTGLLNRRGIFTALGDLPLERAVTVLLLDLDLFKQVNDTHGHHIGDALLQDTARRLRARVPSSADVGRLGGDEFVVITPDLSPEQVAVLCEQITADLGPRPIDGIPVRVGVSIGAARADGETPGSPTPSRSGSTPARGAPRTHDVDDLLRRADAAMYETKQRRKRAADATAGSGRD